MTIHKLSPTYHLVVRTYLVNPLPITVLYAFLSSDIDFIRDNSAHRETKPSENDFEKLLTV